jgi:Fe-S cluster biosynthesis and repair protein YggX
MLDHHTTHQPYISFQLYQVNYIDDDSKKQNKKKDWFYFDLLFCQNPDIFNDITIEHLYEQLCLFAWQDWMHHSTAKIQGNHLKPGFPVDCDWIDKVHIFLPASNYPDEKGCGAIIGLPNGPNTTYSKRFLLNLNEEIHKFLCDFVPDYLKDYDDYVNNVGIHASQYSAKSKSKQYAVTSVHVDAPNQEVFNDLK